ncbi:MAG: murein L,D-transpeptidase catalytic domain family protein [Legionellales bacterium]|nr:murein L,D-transpeptidase catalytic domain family protein [Legionellales bacterium]
MCKSIKKTIAIMLVIIIAAVVLLLLAYLFFHKPNVETTPSANTSQPVAVQQQPASTPVEPVISPKTNPENLSALNTTESAKKLPTSQPKTLVGNLPMAPLSGKGFTPTTLYGYSNPLALITAVHQKTLKILSEGGNLKPVVLQMALRAYACARAEDIGKPRYLSIIDYSLPSTTNRMWVIDLKTATVSYHTLVAHGKNSGYIYTTSFSNSPGSDSSSIGLFLTGNTYIGHNGYSLRLKGLEKGFNDNALERAVVIHGAAYVNSTLVKSNGRIGRSWGCPALSKPVATPVINEIKDGTLLFAYYPQPSWEKKSTYLHCSVTLPWKW